MLNHRSLNFYLDIFYKIFSTVIHLLWNNLWRILKYCNHSIPHNYPYLSFSSAYPYISSFLKDFSFCLYLTAHISFIFLVILSSNCVKISDSLNTQSNSSSWQYHPISQNLEITLVEGKFGVSKEWLLSYRSPWFQRICCLPVGK